MKSFSGFHLICVRKLIFSHQLLLHNSRITFCCSLVVHSFPFHVFHRCISCVNIKWLPMDTTWIVIGDALNKKKKSGQKTTTTTTTGKYNDMAWCRRWPCTRINGIYSKQMLWPYDSVKSQTFSNGTKHMGRIMFNGPALNCATEFVYAGT